MPIFQTICRTNASKKRRKSGRPGGMRRLALDGSPSFLEIADDSIWRLSVLCLTRSAPLSGAADIIQDADVEAPPPTPEVCPGTSRDALLDASRLAF